MSAPENHYLLRAKPMNAKDRLIFPLDVPNIKQAQRYVTQLGEHVGVFKVGLELFVAEGPSAIETIADSTDAGIFLDLKLHDIPATVQRALRSASYMDRITFVTVHCDPSLLQAVVSEMSDRVGVLAVTVLTSLDVSDLLTMGIRPELAEDPVRLVLGKAAIAREAGCAGVVCSGREVQAVKGAFGEDLITVTPGIRPDWSTVQRDDQKRVVTPYQAIRDGADYIVVGRPIRAAADPVDAAARVVQEIEQGFQARKQSA
jgi:orotidine-5'-phosphate decarboxylase